jgi:hypothetical protein
MHVDGLPKIKLGRSSFVMMIGKSFTREPTNQWQNDKNRLEFHELPDVMGLELRLKVRPRVLAEGLSQLITHKATIRADT